MNKPLKAVLSFLDDSIIEDNLTADYERRIKAEGEWPANILYRDWFNSRPGSKERFSTLYARVEKYWKEEKAKGERFDQMIMSLSSKKGG